MIFELIEADEFASQHQADITPAAAKLRCPAKDA